MKKILQIFSGNTTFSGRSWSSMKTCNSSIFATKERY